jgi:hypothetical protein
MYTQWSTFLPLIQPHLPSCPIATINTYLASTTADFCMRTQLWRETYESEYTVANQAEYDLCGGVAKVEAIQWVTCNGIELSGTDPRLIDHTELTRTGQPVKIGQILLWQRCTEGCTKRQLLTLRSEIDETLICESGNDRLRNGD